MFALLIKGGPVMFFILGSSVIALAIAIERIIYYRITRSQNKRMMESVTKLVREDNLQEALNISSRAKSAIGQITHVYLDNVGKGESILEEAVNVESQRHVLLLEKHLPILSAVSNLAPLMGLLGTVIGMIYVFKDIAALGGQADINVLAGGIWQALLTTAFGLVVAIPVSGFHHYFQNLVYERISRIERRVSELNLLFGITCCDDKSSTNSMTQASVGTLSRLEQADETLA